MVLQIFDWFSGDSDEQRKERQRMATQRRAREGYGGGSEKLDQAYDPNVGATKFGSKEKGYTHQVIAPRNGVMGAMVPGKPETWQRIEGSDLGSQQAARRYQQLGGDMSGINGRRVPVGYTGMADMSGDPILPTRVVAPETVVEAPGNGTANGGGARGAGGGAVGGGSAVGGGVGPSNTETRTNANNVTQTGRNLGKINLSPSAGVADFTGPSFPTQAATNQLSAAYPNTTPEGLERVDLGEGIFGFANSNGRIMGLEGDPAQKPLTSVQLPETETSSYQTFDANDPRFADAFGEDLAKSLGGSSRYGDSGARTPKKPARRRRSGDIRDRDIDARGGFDPRSDSRGGSDDESAFQPADYAISGQEARRRAAFLDSPGGSLGGIQAVDDGLGRKRMGGKTYFAVNGDYQEVKPEEFRELGQIDQSKVDSWRADWMKTNINTDSGAAPDSGVPTPAVAQQPSKNETQTPQTNFNLASQQPRINDFTVNNKIQPQYGAAGNQGFDSFGNPPKLNTIRPNDFKMNNNIWGG